MSVSSQTASVTRRASVPAVERSSLASPPAQPALSNAESGLSFGWLIRAIRKSWHWIVVAVVASTVASVLYTKSLPKIYEASALVEFVPDVIRPLGEKDDSSRFWGIFMDNREYYETQYQLITSDLVLGQIVRDLNLANDPEFIGPKTPRPLPLEDTIAMLRDRLRVEPNRTSRLVYIKCEDTSPAMAAKLCGAVAKGYVRQNRDKQLKGTAEAAEWLGGQLEHYRGELESNENRLHEFKKKNDLPSSSPEEVSKMVRLEMQYYDEALAKTRTKRLEYAARHAELSKISSENADQLPASELLSNAFLSTLRTQYQNAIRERRELVAEGKGDNHPSVKKADEKVEQTRRDLLAEVRNIQGSVGRDLNVVSRQEGGASGLYETARKKAVDLNLKELEYHRLDRARVQNEKLYGVLVDQLKEAELARMMNVETIRVVDFPVTPKDPIRPKLPANVGIGLLLGVLAGLGFALAREQLDASVKTPEEVEEHLGLNFLGVLPAISDEVNVKKVARRVRQSGAEKPELLVHSRPLSPFAEATRAVRTNLLFTNPDHPPKLLVVTSAAPGEGKTTVACSLAIAMAQAGKTVCIIDCDLRRPRLHRVFDRAGDGGVTNYLLGEATVDEIAKPTGIGNLWSIPSGLIPPNPADILGTEKFRTFVEEAAQRFDHVIIDSPPVAPVADAAVIATLADGVVFVVRAFATSRHLAKHGLRTLEDIGVPILGAILNAVDFDKQQRYYQYYYYKREGYGQREGMGESPAPESKPSLTN
jgi:polysaccharide biosynthesis transport protein